MKTKAGCENKSGLENHDLRCTAKKYEVGKERQPIKVNIEDLNVGRKIKTKSRMPDKRN